LDDIYASLNDAIDQIFASNFKDFLHENLSVDRWVITSDFNFDSAGSQHDVFAFSLFPVKIGGIKETSEYISGILSDDFKRTDRVNKARRNIINKIEVFSFVLLLQRPFKLLRSGDSGRDRVEIYHAIQSILERAPTGKKGSFLGLSKLMTESKKKNFSIKMMERILILSKMYALISDRLQSITIVRQIYWLPDRDNLTTYCESAWWELAEIQLTDRLLQKITRKMPAKIGIIRPNDIIQQDKFDPLIRIPDYLAAAFSRWDVAANVILPPADSKKKALGRYANVITHWFAGNPRIWVAQLRLEDDILRTRVLTGVRTKRRIRRASLN